jgi:hypothetical protein
MKKCIIPTLILAFACCAIQARAQRVPSGGPAKNDAGVGPRSIDLGSGSGAVRNGEPAEASRSVALRASLSYDIMSLDLRDRKFSERTTRYMRDRELFAGVGVYYYGFGVDARLGVLDTDDQNNKKVECYDLRAGYFSRAFGAEVYYIRSGRMHITSSPAGTGRLWNESNSGSRIKSEQAGLNLFLFVKDLNSLNKNFSYNAAFFQSEGAVKTSGTVLVLLSGDYERMRSSVPLIPTYARDLFLYLDVYGMSGWLFAGLGFGVGFAGTLALPRGFFVSALISLMVRPLQKEFYTLRSAKREFRIDALKGRGRVYAGYSGASFFTGISLDMKAFLTPCYRFKLEMWSGDIYASFFSGVRI